MTRAGANVWAVVPVKDFAQAKSRLADVLSAAERSALARQLFEHVRGAVANARGVSHTLIATDSTEIAELAERAGLHSLLDGSCTGLGPVIDHALTHAAARGAEAALVVMGDLARIAVADVEALLAALHDADVVLAPDRAIAGTNAMALALPARAPTCFGHADSYGRHQAWCKALGLSSETLVRNGLSFDLDTPADLAALQAQAR